MYQQTTYQPQPSGKGTKFYLHLSNVSEFLSWFSFGLALSFIVQLLPKLTLLYPLAFVLCVSYLISSFGTNKTGNLLRLVAVTSSLVGFWNLGYLYRDNISVIAIAFIVLLAVGGMMLWHLLRSKQ